MKLGELTMKPETLASIGLLAIGIALSGRGIPPSRTNLSESELAAARGMDGSAAQDADYTCSDAEATNLNQNRGPDDPFYASAPY